MSSEVGFCRGFKYGMEPNLVDVSHVSCLMLPKVVYDISSEENDHKVISLLKAGATALLVPILLVVNVIQAVVGTIFCLFTACFMGKEQTFAQFRVVCGNFVRSVVQITIIGEIILLVLSRQSSSASQSALEPALSAPQSPLEQRQVASQRKSSSFLR